MCLLRLPFRIDQSRPLHLRQIDDVDTVGTVNRDTSSTGHITHDLIPRHRRTALGKSHRQIRDALYYDTALGLHEDRLVHTTLRICCIVLRNACQNFLVGHLFLMVTVVQLLHLVDDLTLFQSTVSYGRQYRIPVPESILAHNGIHILLLLQAGKIDASGFAVAGKQILAL